MKKRKHVYITLMVLFFLLIDLKLEHVIKYKKHLFQVKSQFNTLLYDYSNFTEELPIIHNNHGDEPIDYIEKSKAISDVEYLHSLLKYGYAGYEFFGGDNIFNTAKENMMWSIGEILGDSISRETFLDIIISELKFIQDSHFAIDNHTLCTYTKYFSTDKIKFLRDNKGLYTFIDNKKYYLKTINNNTPWDYIRKSLDEDGNIVYSLGILSDEDSISIPINILLESNHLVLEKKISLFQYIPLYGENNMSYKYYEADNIPILQVNSLSRTAISDNSIEDFIEDSKTFRNKDTMIIDLRGNIGGNMINMEKWYEGFTGTTLRKDIIESGLYTNTSVDLSKNKFESKENEPDNIKDDCLETIAKYESQKYFPGWSPIEYVDFKPIDNKTNIFILMDKNTSSASEFFIYYLKKLNNVTLIGTNSNGCMLTGNCNSAVLPNSNIPIYISHKIYINKDFRNIDGLGIFPDLWVKPEQSLDRIIKYIKKVS